MKKRALWHAVSRFFPVYNGRLLDTLDFIRPHVKLMPLSLFSCSLSVYL
jgi:hypothetical protein